MDMPRTSEISSKCAFTCGLIMVLSCAAQEPIVVVDRMGFGGARASAVYRNAALEGSQLTSDRWVAYSKQYQADTEIVRKLYLWSLMSNAGLQIESDGGTPFHDSAGACNSNGEPTSTSSTCVCDCVNQFASYLASDVSLEDSLTVGDDFRVGQNSQGGTLIGLFGSAWKPTTSTNYLCDVPADDPPVLNMAAFGSTGSAFRTLGQSGTVASDAPTNCQSGWLASMWDLRASARNRVFGYVAAMRSSELTFGDFAIYRGSFPSQLQLKRLYGHAGYIPEFSSHHLIYQHDGENSPTHLLTCNSQGMMLLVTNTLYAIEVDSQGHPTDTVSGPRVLWSVIGAATQPIFYSNQVVGLGVNGNALQFVDVLSGSFNCAGHYVLLLVVKDAETNLESRVVYTDVGGIIARASEGVPHQCGTSTPPTCPFVFDAIGQLSGQTVSGADLYPPLINSNNTIVFCSTIRKPTENTWAGAILVSYIESDSRLTTLVARESVHGATQDCEAFSNTGFFWYEPDESTPRATAFERLQPPVLNDGDVVAFSGRWTTFDEGTFCSNVNSRKGTAAWTWKVGQTSPCNPLMIGSSRHGVQRSNFAIGITEEAWVNQVSLLSTGEKSESGGDDGRSRRINNSGDILLRVDTCNGDYDDCVTDVALLIYTRPSAATTRQMCGEDVLFCDWKILGLCFADVNLDGSIDGADVEPWYELYASGSSCADVNFDGGVDGTDMETWYEAWSIGECW